MHYNLDDKNEAMDLGISSQPPSPRKPPAPLLRKLKAQQPKFHRSFSTGTIPRPSRQIRRDISAPSIPHETDISPVTVGGFPSQLHQHINKLVIQHPSFSSGDLTRITLVSDNARLLPATVQVTPFKMSPFLSNFPRETKTSRWTSETPPSPSVSTHSLFSPSSSASTSSTRISRKTICKPGSIPPPPIELAPTANEVIQKTTGTLSSIACSDSAPVAPQRSSGRYFQRMRSIIVDVEEVDEDEDINEDDKDNIVFPPPTNAVLALAARKRNIGQYGGHLESKQDSLLVRPERIFCIDNT